jgi:DNA transformation protein
MLAGMINDKFVVFVLDQLKPLGNVQTKHFFASLLLSVNDTKLGLINGEKLFFHVDDTTRPKYEAMGMSHYQPRPNFNKRDEYQVPPEIVEDQEKLLELAKEALNTQSTSKASKPARAASKKQKPAA